MTLMISEALFNNGEHKYVVSPNDMNVHTYRETFRGKLYCPHPNCDARLSYVEFTNSPIQFFRTWRLDVHTDDCPFAIEYEELIRTRRTFNPEYHYALSDEHIDAVLRRAHRVLHGLPPTGSSRGTKNKSPLRTEVDPTLDPAGVVALLGEELDLMKGREPKIFIRNAFDLSQRDHDGIRCVIGSASFMWLDDNYAYLNLVSPGTQIKIHFNEAFIATNRAEYALFHHIKRYIQDHPNSIVCCIGRVSFTETGYDIRPDRYSGFSVDGKKLYAIVLEYIPSL